jgi:hypothetical protein
MSAQSSEPSQPSDRLDGWKEIAAYLDRDVTTAIRWERERELPVHRLPGARRSSVHAFRREIDAWLIADPVRRPSLQPPVADGAHPESALLTSRPSRPRTAARVLSKTTAVVAVGLLLVVAATAGIRRGYARVQVPLVDRIELQPTGLIAFAGDAVAWRHPFGERRLFMGLIGPNARPTPRYAIADVNGDGAPEVVASLSFADGGNVFHDELHCFSAAGQALWSLTLRDEIVFAEGRFGPDWIDGHVIVLRVDGQARILWSQNHHTWWPGLLVVLDGRGRRLSTFVQAGQIRALAVSERQGRPLVLVGGMNNAYRAAALAVLDGSSLRGHAPVPAGSAYECLSCSPELPSRYFLFAPSDVNAASGLPYDFVRQVAPMPDGYEVYTLETGSGIAPPPVGEVVYRFSLGFDLLRAAVSDTWVPAHAVFEQSGQLDHGGAECPLLRHGPAPVRAWEPARGWRELRPLAPTQ